MVVVMLYGWLVKDCNPISLTTSNLEAQSAVSHMIFVMCKVILPGILIENYKHNLRLIFVVDLNKVR